MTDTPAHPSTPAVDVPVDGDTTEAESVDSSVEDPFVAMNINTPEEYTALAVKSY